MRRLLSLVNETSNFLLLDTESHFLKTAYCGAEDVLWSVVLQLLPSVPLFFMPAVVKFS